MKKLLISTLLLVALGNVAMAESTVAVVDIQAVVNKSEQVQALKKEQQAKIKEFEKWFKIAQADIEKQKTQEGKEKLLKKYNADAEKKKAEIAKNYQTKLQEIDKSISDTIANEAKLKCYDLVITKQGGVLYSSLDITEDLIKIVK